MTLSLTPMSPTEQERADRNQGEAGVGALHTERGNLPLERLDVRSSIAGLTARTTVTTGFVNTHDVPLEATYVFPLPDRAAVTGMTMTADGRTVTADLQERGAARERYDQAIAAGQRASIAEEDRPDVFTMRVGNIVPGERVTVELTMVGPLIWEDDAATFRFPLVVAPRYIPGAPLSGSSAGDGHAPDTDAVPDASRITPPVLLPGFPNPLALSVDIDIDPAGFTLGAVRSSLHGVVTDGNRVSLRPGERADRDVVLRLPYAGGGTALACVPDADGEQGTYRLTVLPPSGVEGRRPRDVVLLLDRSGSMGGWKMVAARRAAARIVDSLTTDDRFAVLAFDHVVEPPADLGAGLVDGTDRHRYRAVEHLARMDARGGTELLAPLRDGLALLAGRPDPDRDAVLVLVTDGQVGNEDQILRTIAPDAASVRIHTVGIDRAVNAGFLGRLAALGGGRCELVESEDRLDEAMEHIQRRIGSPLVTGIELAADGFAPIDGTRSPHRLPGLYPGVPLVVAGRYAGAAGGRMTVRGTARDGADWSVDVPAHEADEPAVTPLWARAQVRDLEDRYAIGETALEGEIVRTSLRFGVLCRFTAYVAVDERVVADGDAPHRVVQPVERPSGWDLAAGAPPAPPMAAPMAAYGMAPPASGASMPSPAMPRAGMPVAAMPPAMPSPAAPRTSFAAGTSFAPGSGGGGGGDAAGPPRGSMRRASKRAASPEPPADGGLGPVTAILTVEAERLRAAAGRPDYERRELLADLASRLDSVLTGLPAAYQPLRELAALLAGPGGDLEARWAEALRVLDGFTGAGEPAAEPTRKPPFWKR